MGVFLNGCTGIYIMWISEKCFKPKEHNHVSNVVGVEKDNKTGVLLHTKLVDKAHSIDLQSPSVLEGTVRCSQLKQMYCVGVCVVMLVLVITDQNM